MATITRLRLKIVNAIKKCIDFFYRKICYIVSYRATVTIAIICHEQNIEGIKRIIERQIKKPDNIVLYYSNEYFGDAPLEWKIVKCPNLNDWGHGKCKQAIEEATSDFICFFNADSYYEDNYLSEMMKRAREGFDVVLCDFKHRPDSNVIVAHPIIGGTDRGNVLVCIKEARRVGYNYSIYEADGLFIQDMVKQGASWIRVNKCLYINN
ncbi:glycosyltransferase [Cyanobacterium sp. DS4]|uniref:glycosyltransferase n=1 Tax=Cyanobacterium sp. DS4 TaxID=2878255 RepID=UPI002E811186|nr:glycosyltransferase [Cyanobacterium sp. Dongsha4]WVK98900.1 glycosyltransferase [Cyanobacterium sp. Dongsha4]